jgi:mitochondrial fission protein ELM1
VVDAVIRAAETLDADVLVTTSRRTQRAVEFALKESYGKSARVKLLLIANEENFDGAVEGILAASGILVVSGESIAMLTEAVSSEKPVIAFMPGKIKLSSSTKHEKSLKRLETENLVKVSGPEGIERDITGYIGRKVPGSGAKT